MADQEIALNIIVEVEKANKSLASFESTAKNMSNNVDKAFSAIKIAASAAVAVFAGREVVKFFSEGIDAAQKQEKALSQLTKQLELTGSYSDEAIKSFKEFADQTEETSRFSDDFVLSQLSVAKAMGLSNEQSKELIKASVELSAVNGKDLNTNVEQLGKTYKGTAGRLGETIPILKTLTSAQLESGEAIKLILERFKGSSLADINTFGGAIIQAGNAFDNFREAFGKIIIENPKVIAIIKEFTSIFRELTDEVDGNEEIIKAFGDSIIGILSSFKIAIDVAGTLTKGLFYLGGGFTYVLGAITALGGAVINVLLRPFDLIIASSNKLAQGFYLIAKAVADFSGNEDQAKKFDELAKSMSNLASKKFGEAISSDLGILNKTGLSITEDGKALIDTGKNIGVIFDKVSGGIDKLKDASNETGKIIKKVNDSSGDVSRKAGLTAEELSKLKDEAMKFVNDINTASLSEIDKINKARAEQLAKLKSFQDQGVIDVKTAANAKIDIEKKAAADIYKIQQDARKQYESELEKAKSANDKYLADKDASFLKSFNTSAGFISNSLEGQQGAKSAVSSAAGLAADAFLPGSGGAVSGIVGQLAAGPEQTKAMVKAFVEAIPDIIEAIAESIPVVVETLVDYLINEGGAIRIGMAIVNGMFSIIGSIGEGLGLSFTGTVGENINAAFSGVYNYFRDSFGGDIKEAFSVVFDPFIDFFKSFRLPEFKTPKWVDDLVGAVESLSETPGWVEDLQSFIDKLQSIGKIGGGGGGKGPLTGIPGSPLATGGTIPSGYPNDSFLARLTSGERVLNVKENEKLDKLIDSGGLSNNNADLAGILLRIASILEGGQNVNATIKINDKVLADSILNLNRRNARIA